MPPRKLFIYSPEPWLARGIHQVLVTPPSPFLGARHVLCNDPWEMFAFLAGLRPPTKNAILIAGEEIPTAKFVKFAGMIESESRPLSRFFLLDERGHGNEAHIWSRGVKGSFCRLPREGCLQLIHQIQDFFNPSPPLLAVHTTSDVPTEQEK